MISNKYVQFVLVITTLHRKVDVYQFLKIVNSLILKANVLIAMMVLLWKIICVLKKAIILVAKKLKNNSIITKIWIRKPII
jgi:hypothetical protein